MAAGDMHSHTIQQASSFTSLPVELLEKIQVELGTDLEAHVTFASLNQSTRQLYDEAYFRQLLLSSELGRPCRWGDRSWRQLATAIVRHAQACNLSCGTLLRSEHRQVDGHVDGDAVGRSSLGNVVIHESARDTRYVRLVSQLRNSVRVYDVDWQAANTILGPKLFVPATSLEGQHAHDILPQRASLALIHHVPFACRLATTVPLRKLTCAFESTEFWGFMPASTAAAATSALTSNRDHGVSRVKLPHPSLSEREDLASVAGKYRSYAYNPDGLTCLDVLEKACETPGIPFSLDSHTPLLFNGILDDMIRQGEIWIQARPNMS